MFHVDASDPTPLYAQLDQAIRLAMATGRLAVGDRLPTVRQLAVELKVNANTVAKVYAELERAGLLETRRGVGTFVSAVTDSSRGLAERRRRLESLADRFLAGAADLGFSADQAVGCLNQRVRDDLKNSKGTENEHGRQERERRE